METGCAFKNRRRKNTLLLFWSVHVIFIGAESTFLVDAVEFSQTKHNGNNGNFTITDLTV